MILEFCICSIIYNEQKVFKNDYTTKTDYDNDNEKQFTLTKTV